MELFSATLGMTGTYKTQDNKYARVKFDFRDDTPEKQEKVFIIQICETFGTLKFYSS